MMMFAMNLSLLDEFAALAVVCFSIGSRSGRCTATPSMRNALSPSHPLSPTRPLSPSQPCRHGRTTEGCTLRALANGIDYPPADCYIKVDPENERAKVHPAYASLLKEYP